MSNLSIIVSLTSYKKKNKPCAQDNRVIVTTEFAA